MRVEKTYFAFDETEFDSEEECLAYEREVRSKFGSALFYNKERKPVDVSEDGYGDVYYIRIVNKAKAPALFAWVDSYYGMEVPDNDYEDGDILVYDYGRDEWVNLNAQLRWTQGVLDLFKKEGEQNGAEGHNPSA